MDYDDRHDKFLKPCVRVRSQKAGGSGTILFSKEGEDGEYSTYVLTNHHVVEDLIKVEKRWSALLKRDVKQDILIGFLRLRIPHKPFRPEMDEKTSLIRELHIYGPMVEIGEKPRFEWQHRGYGRELLSEAEKISGEEFDMKKILVTSGVGAKEYYKKLGYMKKGVYMGKKLTAASN